MPRPDDATVSTLAGCAMERRTVVHAAPGRCVERVVAGGRPYALKWRDDREDDREATLYTGLAPPLLAALGAPRHVASGRVGATHLLLLEWVEGRHPDYQCAEDVERVFVHLGRAAALSSDLLRGPREAFADESAWRVLLPETVDLAAGASDPAVLDPGDLRVENVIFRCDGGVSVLDFENMAIRPRSRVLRALGSDEALPSGPLAELARHAYARGGRGSPPA